jgi:hypothetical protein
MGDAESDSWTEKARLPKSGMIAAAAKNNGRLAVHFLKDPWKMLDGGKPALRSDLADGQLRMPKQFFSVPDSYFVKKPMDGGTDFEIEKFR